MAERFYKFLEKMFSVPESLFNTFCIFQYIVLNETAVLPMSMGSGSFGFFDVDRLWLFWWTAEIARTENPSDCAKRIDLRRLVSVKISCKW